MKHQSRQLLNPRRTRTRTRPDQRGAATASLETDRGTESNTGSKTHVTSVDEACNSEDCKAESEGPTSDPPASVKEDGTTNIKPDQYTPTPKIPCVIMVRPAAPENTVTLESESKAEDSPDVKEDNTMDVEGDHHSPSTPRPRRLVIMVQAQWLALCPHSRKSWF